MATREHTGTFRFGKVIVQSDDKGPYKILGIEVDGKEIDCLIADPMGIAVNPKPESMAFVLTPDSDEGRAVALIFPAPADRVDQLKAAEMMIKQYLRNQSIFFDDAGNLIFNSGDKAGNTIHNTPQGTHQIDAKNDVLISGGSTVHLNPV